MASKKITRGRPLVNRVHIRADIRHSTVLFVAEKKASPLLARRSFTFRTADGRGMLAMTFWRAGPLELAVLLKGFGVDVPEPLGVPDDR